MPRPAADRNDFEFSWARAAGLAGVAAGAFGAAFVAVRLARAGDLFRLLFLDPAGSVATDALIAALATCAGFVLWALAQAARAGAHYRDTAKLDDVTRLYARQLFHEILTAELARATRLERPLSVVRIRIGRGEGGDGRSDDQRLRDAADALRGALRQYDTPARIEAADLAVILPETTATQAAAALTRTRRLIEQGARVAVRHGIAEFQAGMTSDDLLRATLDAMPAQVTPQAGATQAVSDRP